MAGRSLGDRIGRAEVPGVARLGEMARTLAGHRAGLPAYDDQPIGTGPPEGTDIEIETLGRQADGFRDRELFKLKEPGDP